MKTYILGSIDGDSFKEFNDFMDYEGQKQMYINSGGGASALAFAMIDRLNREKDSVVLRGIFLGSRGFTIFNYFQGEKHLERDCDAVLHAEAIELHTFKNGLRSSDPCERGRYEDTISRQPDQYSFLTDEENKRIADGYDVYLNYERLKNIFTS